MTTTQPGAPQEQISAMSQETVFCLHAQGRALASAVGASEGTVTSTNFIREKGCVFFIQQDLDHSLIHRAKYPCQSLPLSMQGIESQERK